MLQMSPYPENPSRSGAVRASHELGRAIWAGADDLIQVSWLLSALLSSVSIADRQHTTTVMPFTARASAMLSQLIFAVYCADPTAADGDRDAGKRRRAAADAAVRLTTYTAAYVVRLTLNLSLGLDTTADSSGRHAVRGRLRRDINNRSSSAPLSSPSLRKRPPTGVRHGPAARSSRAIGTSSGATPSPGWPVSQGRPSGLRTPSPAGSRSLASRPRTTSTSYLPLSLTLPAASRRFTATLATSIVCATSTSWRRPAPSGTSSSGLATAARTS